MNGAQRLAGLWGALFPLAALVLFSVILGFTGRGTTPASQSGQAQPGQTSAASQTTAQNGGNTSGGGASPAAMSGGPAGGATANPPVTANPQSSGNAQVNGTPSGSAAAGTSPSGNMAGGAAAPATPPASGGPAASPASASAAAGGSQANSGASGTGTPATTAQAPADGTQIYSSNCSSCHSPAGAGVVGAFPPLAGNKAILGSEKYVSDVLLYGLQGQIEVGGQNYNGVMPAWAGSLSDAQIAAVLTHIRSSWGNSAPAVAEATVKTERASTMTTAQVLAERPQ